MVEVFKCKYSTEIMYIAKVRFSIQRVVKTKRWQKQGANKRQNLETVTEWMGARTTDTQ